MLLVYLPTSDLLAGGPPEFELKRIGELLENMVRMQVLVAYNENQAWIAYAVFAFLIFLSIWTFWKNWKTSTEPITGQGAFLILFAVLFGLYLILPNSIGPGGWVNDRLLILTTLTIFALG